MPLSELAFLDYIAAYPGAVRDEIRGQAAPDAGGMTVWRALKRLVEAVQYHCRDAPAYAAI